jgi:SAM-dependent MidA family methyltransferase
MTAPSPVLPAPGAAALAHSERLQRRIVAAIREQGGAIRFSRFVELALYEPGLGYYSAGATKFGPAGDFVTAPELGPLFGRCLARWAAGVLDDLGGGEVLELGGGSGALAADLLGAMDALDAPPRRYRILEVSADLRSRQRARVAELAPALAARVEWLEAVPEAPFRGLILANEVLDALPFERFRIRPDGARALGVTETGVTETGVTETGGVLDWAELPPGPDLETALAAIETDLGRPFPAGYESECCPGIAAWMAAVTAPLAAGAALFIDYGLPRRAYYHPERAAGTMMCHYRHRAHTDPFLWPGLQDISAWVDFTAVADAGLAADLELLGFTTQAAFLLESGADEVITEAAGTDPGLAAAGRRLLLPGEMGERFKVMGFGRGRVPPLPGLTLSDLSGSL